ncbi:sigma-54-dependent transcriptional regulator [Marinobacter sp.]|uniref:sigma-54-dependent transcriptional regulator n=1 Tax=Marinobacter sp. TaxID=50741 RepID=UPI003562B49F
MNDASETLLLIEDDASLRTLLQEELALDGYRMLAAANCAEGAAMALAESPDLIISDLRLPDGDGLDVLRKLQAEGRVVPFIIITAFGTVDQAVDALQAGADDFLTKPLSTEHLRLKVRRLLAHAALSLELARYRSASGEPANLGLVGESPAMDRLRQEIRQVARSEAAVLVNGESGTGKELVARAIHRESDRRDGPFIPVNCAGIPPELMESEFFGHEAGAFTGARQTRKGLFAEASGGTLLLDEIGEMPLALQAKLLRVLQEGRVKPVGAEREEPVDVRIVAATHVDLMEAVRQGDFREDLYYRLETLMLTVPPLRQRGDDVELLAMHFLRQSADRHKRGFLRLGEATLTTLADYPFPGNVRELASAMERAVTFCDGEVVQPEHLPARIRKRQASLPGLDRQSRLPAGVEGEPTASWPTLETLQQQYVRQVMERVEGNKRRAAQILGINRRTLYRWLEQRDDAP